MNTLGGKTFLLTFFNMNITLQTVGQNEYINKLKNCQCLTVFFKQITINYIALYYHLERLRS